jgi:LPXTG-motif cell wall-anchored protein
MAGTGRDGQSRRGRLPYRRALIATLALVLTLALAAAPAAFADRGGSPATGQYTLQVPNAGGSGGPGGPQANGASTKVGGSDSSSALPVIGLGALVVGSAGIALLYVRRRRSHEAA